MNCKLVLFFIPLLISIHCHAKEVNLTDFHISTSNKNNTEGFLRLSKWLQGKNDITINFKPGIYYVGQQKVSNDRVVDNLDNIFSLIDCTNIRINGNGATIKFIDNLMYGAFDVKTKAKLKHVNSFRKSENAAYPGNCIYLKNAQKITIKGLILDGNSDHLIVGGIYGDNGIQLWHRGIYVVNSFDVILNNLNIHHFGLDGIEVSNNSLQLKSEKYQTRISNVKCYYNGRQGISWVGGNGLFIENSEFSNTGKAKLCSPPGAGIDIEPEVAACKNGLFVNCKFENNCGPAFISDFHKTKTAEINFKNCTFFGTTASAVWAHNADIKISNSTIIGQILSPGGSSQNERTSFSNCSIYDYNPQNGQKAFFTNFLIDAGGHQKFYDITDSKIYLKFGKLCYLESGSTVESEMPVFKNNEVHFDHAKIAVSDFVGLFRGCVLQNNTFEMNVKEVPEKGLYFVTGHAMKIAGKNTISGKNAKVGWNSVGGAKNISEK